MKITALACCLLALTSTECFSQAEFQAIQVVTEEGLSDRQDTIQALTNFYKRKRNGGKARAIVFGILGTASIVGILTNKPEYVDIHQGSAGTQRIQISSGPGPIDFLFAGFSVVMTATGIAQANNYSPENLETFLEQFRINGRIPLKIRSKLKKKDFKKK